MLHVFYGNLDFEDYIKDVSVVLVDLSKIKTSQEMITAIKKPEVAAGSPPYVVVVKNLWRIKAFYEDYISRSIANSAQPIVVLGDTRFEYFRELKRAVSIFMTSLKDVKHPVILTFPLEEKESNLVHRAYPAGYDDFSLYGQYFHSIVPFVMVDKVPAVLDIVPVISKNVKFSTLPEYIKAVLSEEPVVSSERTYSAK